MSQLTDNQIRPFLKRFDEIRDDLIEFHHFPKNGDEEVYVSVISE